MDASRAIVAGELTLESFKRQNGVREVRRPFGNQPKRRSFLIVCEGEATEPNYFRAIAKCLPRNMVSNVVVEGVGGTPDYLLKFAKQKVEERKAQGQPPFYHVWLVFDRDNFEHFTDTILAVERQNEENKRLPIAERPVEHWHCAWSNEAFELWYILHFREQLGGGISRSRYQEMLQENIRAMTPETGFVYQKNDGSMFRRLVPYVCDAIPRAERGLQKQLAEHGTDWASMNPATCVHQLVRDLLAYMRRGQDALCDQSCRL